MTTMRLSPRSGDRPRTTTTIPHSQLDQQPADRQRTDDVIDAASGWPHVVVGDSGISVEGARALVLDDGSAAGPADAFMVGREFGHAHAQGDYSFHAALPPELALQAETAGWAEPHFLAKTGEVQANVVMIYAPRDDAEREVVLGLLRAAYEYAATPVE
jgi:luciferase-like monooxygenase